MCSCSHTLLFYLPTSSSQSRGSPRPAPGPQLPAPGPGLHPDLCLVSFVCCGPYSGRTQKVEGLVGPANSPASRLAIRDRPPKTHFFQTLVNPLIPSTPTSPDFLEEASLKISSLLWSTLIKKDVLLHLRVSGRW